MLGDENNEEVEEERQGVDRSDFTIDESHGESNEGNLLNVPTDVANLIKNPVNKPYIQFNSEFEKFERLALNGFAQYQESLGDFTALYNENPFYEQMDIVKTFKEVLNRNTNWVSALRQEVFLALETLREIYSIVDSHYFTKSVVDKIRDESNAVLEEEQKKDAVFGVVKMLRNKDLLIELDKKGSVDILDKISIKDIVKVSKGRGIT